MSALTKIRAIALKVLDALASTFFVSAFGRIASQILAAATVFVAARYVSLTEFGYLALGQAVTIILTSLLYTGLHHQVLRSTAFPRENATLFTCQFALGLAGSVLMAAVAVLQPTGSTLQIVLLGLAPIPAIVGPAAHFEAILIREGRIRSAVLSTVVAEVLGFLALCVAFASGAGVYALVLARLVATIVAFVAKAWLAATWPGLALIRGIMRSAFASAKPLYLTTGTQMMSNYGGDLLLGLYLSPAAVGAYRAASRVAVTGSEIIAKPVQTLTWSNLARLEREDDPGAMAGVWLDQAKFLTIVAWPALFALALLSQPVVNLLLDESWGAAAPVISVLAIALAVGILDNIIGPALTCAKQATLYTRVTLATALVVIVALALCAPFGAVAAAYGLLGARLIMAPIGAYFALRAIDLAPSTMLRAMVPSVLVTAACCLTVIVLQNLTTEDVEGFAITAGLGAVCWLAIVGALLSKNIVQLPRP